MSGEEGPRAQLLAGRIEVLGELTILLDRLARRADQVPRSGDLDQVQHLLVALNGSMLELVAWTRQAVDEAQCELALLSAEPQRRAG